MIETLLWIWPLSLACHRPPIILLLCVEPIVSHVTRISRSNHLHFFLENGSQSHNVSRLHQDDNERSIQQICRRIRFNCHDSEAAELRPTSHQSRSLATRSLQLNESSLGPLHKLRNARRWVGGLSPSVTRVLGYRFNNRYMVGGWVKNGRFWRYVIMQWPL